MKTISLDPHYNEESDGERQRNFLNWLERVLKEETQKASYKEYIKESENKKVS